MKGSLPEGTVRTYHLLRVPLVLLERICYEMADGEFVLV